MQPKNSQVARTGSVRGRGIAIGKGRGLSVNYSRGKGTKMGRGYGKGVSYGPLSGIGNWNGVGMSTGTTFIHHSRMVKLFTFA